MKKASDEFDSARLAKAAIPANADEFMALKGEIAAARRALLNMILYSDRHGTDQLRLVNETATKVSAHFARLRAPGGKEAEFKELKETWDSFKQTRETELVPAILAEEKMDYERIGASLQKQRLDRMYALIAVLVG